MKILEATTLIAIIKEIDCPDIINSIFKLNHKLIIPLYVYNELIDSKTKTTCDIFIKENKLTVSNLNSITEIIDLQKTYPFLGRGELDSILHYKKLSDRGIPVYCVLDDKKARKIATLNHILHTGLIGLLKMLKNKLIITAVEYENILHSLKNSNFRIPK